ncbi:uncharacterized protein LOC106367447 [Brassica napus]|uniref:uncharacterized protein LOC106293552 n=1 Tax=Brassica oleracea var. oleracea TaxID=109376 RepID=UPI0006A732DB|nr:PREDICTED: uncharacterized protein LOC106293552 [Brassica oleracea var. oleracea]XP_013662676.1 uncharacterized protein LOC106367447 [Brassica napus]
MGSIGKRKMMMKEEEKLSDQVQQSTCFQPAHVWSNVEPDISSINDVGLIPPWIRISLIRWENISGMQWIPKILAHLLVKRVLHIVELVVKGSRGIKLEEGPEWREGKSKILFNGWTCNGKNK